MDLVGVNIVSKCDVDFDMICVAVVNMANVCSNDICCLLTWYNIC